MKDRGRPRRKQRPGRKTPPPEATGREARYLFKAREIQAPMVVDLLDGRVVTGTVEYYDRDMIKVVPDEGPGLFFRKEDIRRIHPLKGDINV